MMQHLLKSVTSLTWTQLLGPQLPGASCALAVALTVMGLRYLAVAGGDQTVPAALAFSCAGGLASLVLVLGFIRWMPFSDVRLVFDEVVLDLAPRLAPLLGVSPKGHVATVTEPDRTR